MVLAHELGHYLYYLISYKKTVDLTKGDVIAEAIVGTSAGKAAHKATINSVHWAVLHVYPYDEYKKILHTLPNVPPAPPTIAKQMFMELWNHGVFNEIVNILPSANMLQNGGSGYSDGIIIGEAVLDPGCRINKQILFIRKNRHGVNERVDFINLTGANVAHAESFVRLGHVRSKRFWSILDHLIVSAAGNPNIGAAISIVLGGATAAINAAAANPAVVAANNVGFALAEFKDLVQRLLDTITVNGQTLWANNNNLPSF
ncbi:MAG: hypothetical protein LBB16_02805 [Puniceicoccales bacterium]|jgi:hypothetical protein|nr:hypothetical protein [Puniceicoccales bacterium]